MSYSLSVVEREIDTYAEDRGHEQDREDYEDRCIAECIDTLRAGFLNTPDARCQNTGRATYRQQIDEAINPDVDIPAMLDLIRRAAKGEDISDEADSLVLSLAQQYVELNRDSFLRND